MLSEVPSVFSRLLIPTLLIEPSGALRCRLCGSAVEPTARGAVVGHRPGCRAVATRAAWPSGDTLDADSLDVVA
jgi:hypothetical protein